MNDWLDGGTDTVLVTVTGLSNTAPTVDVGVDVEIISNILWTRDGSGSTDPDADQTLTFSWTELPSR